MFLDVKELQGTLAERLQKSCDTTVPLSRDELMDVLDVLAHVVETGDAVPSTKEG